jgi:hypothetical protein
MEVVDVHLDEVGPAVPGGELLQVDRGGHADREGQQEGHHEGQGGAHHGSPDPGQLGLPAVAGAEEAAVERGGHQTLRGQGVEPGHLVVAELALRLRDVPADEALEEHVGVGGERELHALAGAHQVGVLEHPAAQIEAGARAHQRGEVAQILAPAHVGEQLPQGLLHQRRVVGRAEHLRVPGPVGVEDVLGEVDLEGHRVLV